MTLQPLISASPWIQVHAGSALMAFVLGAVQLARPKGGHGHRVLGYLWAGLMLTVAASSFGIREIDQWNGFSLIHLLSIQVLATLPLAVAQARRGAITAHRRSMQLMFLGALVIAGAFTLLPGRIMYKVVFG